MTQKRLASWSFLLLSVLIGAGCGGSDTDPLNVAQDAVERDDGEPGADAADANEAGDADDAIEAAEVGFGELIEGTFTFSGAADEQFFVSDPQLAYRLGGGCQGGAFGVIVNITLPDGVTPVASVSVEMREDLSGGVIGEFDPVDGEVNLFPGGADFSSALLFKGPLRLVVSEHDTGGASSDLNARRMTVTLLGTISGDTGDLDVDVTFRWVMGCP